MGRGKASNLQKNWLAGKGAHRPYSLVEMAAAQRARPAWRKRFVANRLPRPVRRGDGASLAVPDAQQKSPRG